MAAWWGEEAAELRLLWPFKVALTCCAAVRSYVELVACPRLCHRYLVVLGVGCLVFVPQVHSQLVMSRVCDFMEVWETCGWFKTCELGPERVWERSKSEKSCPYRARTHCSCSRSQRCSSSSSCRIPAFHFGVGGRPAGGRLVLFVLNPIYHLVLTNNNTIYTRYYFIFPLRAVNNVYTYINL